MQPGKFLCRLHVFRDMQKMTLFFLIVMLGAPLFPVAQDKNEELLNWSANRRLTWSDYKGTPDPGSDAAASTSTYLSIEFNISNTGLGYKIKSRFSKTRSWGVAKTEYILAHEQGHFDISELFARKLDKKMKEYRFNKQSYQKDLDKIYSDITKEKEKMQRDYDSETDHSIDREKQAAWLKKISDQLEAYKEYANY